jgi:hypothetical protein
MVELELVQQLQAKECFMQAAAAAVAIMPQSILVLARLVEVMADMHLIPVLVLLQIQGLAVAVDQTKVVLALVVVQAVLASSSFVTLLTARLLLLQQATLK